MTGILRRLTLAPLALLTLTACEPNRLVGLPSGVSVTATESIVAGEAVHVVLTNASRAFVQRDPCELTLERRQGDGWHMEVGTFCEGGGAPLVTLAPGEVVRDTIHTAIVMPAGDYRVRYDLRGPDGRRLPESDRVSNLVVVTAYSAPDAGAGAAMTSRIRE